VGSCSPLEEALAVDLGVKVRQLQSYLKELENYTRGDPPKAVPLLAVTRVWVEKDRKTRNSYTLLWLPFLGVAPKETGTTRAHLVNGGDAQSVAHRSGGNTQNRQPVSPVLPIPSEEGGIVGPDVSPSDRQSYAHRSVDEPQHTAPERLTIPGGDDGTVADGRPPSDAQYPAHRSEGYPQDTAAERPTIPGGDDGTVADGRPSSDAQYPAHRSEGYPQDTAAERPTIPSGDDGTVADGRPPGDSPDTPPERPADDAGTVPDGMQPGDAGARVITTPSYELRRPLTQPSDPALLRYAERPLGPGDCKRDSFPGKCKKCGATVTETHLMLRLMSGAFCERCCPACHSGA
jgi:hypothetical protein